MKIFEDYISYLENKDFSKYTIKSYKEDIRDFSYYLDIKKVSNINIVDYKFLRGYLAHISLHNYKNKTVARKISTIKSLYKYLIKMDIVKNNPASLIKTPKKEMYLPRFLTYDEVDSLINSFDDTILGVRNKLVLELLYSTGIRVSELVSIKLNDIDYYNKSILIFGKGKKERYVLFGNKLEVILKTYLQVRNEFNPIDDILILNKYGKNLSDRSIRNIINKASLICGIEKNISPHTFRHTFATHMLDSGASIRIVSELLGHENLSTTQIYTHLTNEKIREVYCNSHPRAIIDKK